MSKNESTHEYEYTNWVYRTWRPACAWTYIATCIFDFIISPILYNILQFHTTSQALSMWKPLTLEGGGLYHLSMGAILGISAWSRGNEKIAYMKYDNAFSNMPVNLNSSSPNTTTKEKDIHNEESEEE